MQTKFTNMNQISINKKLLTNRRAYWCKSGDYSTIVDFVCSDPLFFIFYNHANERKSTERHERSSTGRTVQSVYQVSPQKLQAVRYPSFYIRQVRRSLPFSCQLAPAPSLGFQLQSRNGHGQIHA